MPMPRSPEAARLVVIKIGSAVLTDANGLDSSVLDSLAAQIAALLGQRTERRIIIVSSGAVAAGRATMAEAGEPVTAAGQVDRQALAAIGQARLMRAWNEAFAPHALVSAQALLTRDDFRVRERFSHASNTFARMLEWKVVPIVNENDTVSVHELKFGDNDTLASFLVNLVQADLFINLTSAPGVLADNPQNNPVAPVLDTIEDISALDIDSLCGPKTAAGSGGMHSKLLAARRLSQLGVPTLILPGRKKGVLLRAFGLEKGGRPEGTWVCAAPKAISRRKFWLAYQSEPEGIIEIDRGAADALRNNGRSLLPGGITGVSGDFPKGALVRISYDGSLLGVGFSNYSSDEIAKIHGLKRHEIAAILGEANYPDAVHRDNLLLDAAI